jgi:hypothetical protein
MKMRTKMETMNDNKIGINRIIELQKKISAGNGTQQEKNELMRLLYENNSLPLKMYTKYINGKDANDLMETGLMLGTFIRFGQELRKLKSIALGYR